MKPSLLAKAVLGCAMTLMLLSCVSTPRHPNLVAAQELVQQAIAKLAAAQQANKFDMKGHAERAKQLLDQAISEIQLAEAAASGG